MKTRFLYLIYVLLCMTALSCNSTSQMSLPYDSDGPSLVNNQKSTYKIVLPAGATDSQKKAASELNYFLKQISGANLPIITDDKPATGPEIILGENRRLKKLNTDIDFDKLGPDGFTIRSIDDNLVIAGDSTNGTLYGVYTFLEDYLGCRWYTSKVTKIPKQTTIKLPAIDDTQIPILEYREVHYFAARNLDFSARHKLNGSPKFSKNGKIDFQHGWGTWCHSCFYFVPPEKYFDDHPEYFSLIDGKRRPTQVCHSNPDVFDITAAKLSKMIANSDDIYWDFSQMDNHDFCQCTDCNAINTAEGTPMAAQLTFVNKLARRFPDKIISTLAYISTRHPPKTMRPEKNVSIMLCSFECSRILPIADSTFPQDISFSKNLRDWSRICERLFVWDYEINFSNLVGPHPNLRILQPNIKSFIDHNARGIFAQGNREIGGEFCHLRAYILAKLLWNPDCNVDELIDDFLTGYYGPAATAIRRYIDLMHNAAQRSGIPMGISQDMADHRTGFLSPELIEQYDAIFDQAQQSVADNPALLHRVRTARMPLMYAKLQITHGDLASRRQVAKEFFKLCELNGIKKLHERRDTPAELKAKVTELHEKEMKRSNSRQQNIGG